MTITQFTQNELLAVTTEGLTGEQWYKKTYPFLENKSLPIPEKTLSDYYKSDCKLRGITPNQNLINDYGLLFGYYLENYPKNLADKTKVKSGFEYFIENIPKGISKTTEQVSSGVSSVFSEIKFLVVVVAVIIIAVLFFRGK